MNSEGTVKVTNSSTHGEVDGDMGFTSSPSSSGRSNGAMLATMAALASYLPPKRGTYTLGRSAGLNRTREEAKAHRKNRAKGKAARIARRANRKKK